MLVEDLNLSNWDLKNGNKINSTMPLKSLWIKVFSNNSKLKEISWLANKIMS